MVNKKSFLFTFLLLTLLCASLSYASDNRNLLPVPAEVSWQEGQVPIGSSFGITVIGAQDSRITGNLDRWRDRLAQRIHASFNAAASEPSLVINCKTKGLPLQSVREDESYTLTVTSQKATLSAPNPLGILHGLETLLQLVEEKDKGYVLPCVTIHDQPRFAWRGLLIDACRHWMPVEVIKRNLDGMAEAKLNVFHWHLSENQGFRVESKLYPKLQEMGSDGNFYTQDQIKDIVAYARDRGIRVVPEFDVPGHTTAWLVGYPELAAAPGPYSIERKYGVFDPSMDPSNEGVYKFLGGFIGEMAGLFPDEYFHIGGDEVNGKQWNSNPAIQRFMYQHGLKTNDDLQAYFNSRLEKILTKHHKKMMGWDEILHPDLPKDIVVQSWRGADGLSNCAKQGYDTILSNGYYLDLSQPASQHYAVEPLPPTSPLSASEKAHILGGEACMWSELVSLETVDSRLWPRSLAIAERLWSSAGITDVNNLYDRMEVESFRLEKLGLTHRSNYLPMLQRLAGNAEAVGPLRVLADVVEPVKNYSRHRARVYTSDFPLDRLVDAARCESDIARYFKLSVDSYLSEAPPFGNFRGIIKPLQVWQKNHALLAPLLEKSDKLIEMAPQSQSLSEAAKVGLEAIAYLKSGKPAPAAWQDKAGQTLDRAQEFHAEVQVAVVPAIRKLTLAAGQIDKLKGLAVTDWNKSLDDQVTAKNPKGWN